MDIKLMRLILQDCGIVMKKIWMSPESQKKTIVNILSRKYSLKYKQIFLLGEGKNICLYILLNENYFLVIVPFQKYEDSILLKKYREQIKYLQIDKNVVYIKSEEIHNYLLNLPNILLINLCVIENFPIPRLNLSTGVISAYLRKRQLAMTKIVDMQIGYSIEDIVDIYTMNSFDFIGISVSFGQKDLAIELIEAFYQINNNIQIVIGNIIPALDPNGFLKTFDKLIISYGEGETTFPDLIEYFHGKKELYEVSGIIYFDVDTNKVVKTEREIIDMSEVPLPSLDTLPEIARLKGAATLETSRGCNYAKCTFCPRQHKLKLWRFMTSEQVVEQIGDLLYAMEELNMKKHIYLADEEFIGELKYEDEADRTIKICHGIINKNYKLLFDTSARADSVFNEKKGVEWNLKRIYMWNICKQAGLDRLFLGIESGCNVQLKRFGKGTTIFQNIMAIRILTALGINIRIGFIMFDPLMQDKNELKQNLDFLARTDAIMNLIDIEIYSYKELYELLQDDNFVKNHAANKPIYSVVSYMLASLEVLIGSPYSRMLKNEEKKKQKTYILNYNTPDLNMGRYRVMYVDAEIGMLSQYCQKWIDSNFGLMYTIKSLYKTAINSEKQILYSYMCFHREISQYLLEYLLYALDDKENNRLTEFAKKYEIELLRFSGENVIEKSMNHWQKNMLLLVKKIRNDISNGFITDTYDNRLSMCIGVWEHNYNKWKLINGQEG